MTGVIFLLFGIPHESINEPWLGHKNIFTKNHPDDNEIKKLVIGENAIDILYLYTLVKD